MTAQLSQFANFANGHDPDLYEWRTERTLCEFHRANPQVGPVTGCTCSAASVSVQRSPAEVARIKAARVREMEDRILADAERIRARRARDGEA